MGAACFPEEQGSGRAAQRRNIEARRYVQLRIIGSAMRCSKEGDVMNKLTSILVGGVGCWDANRRPARVAACRPLVTNSIRDPQFFA